MKINYKLERLLKGEIFETKESGNSMTPRLKHQEAHIIKPITWDKCKINDIVYCKIRGRYLTHLVKAIGEKGLLITNIRGKENGWTKNVYGKVKDK